MFFMSAVLQLTPPSTQIVLAGDILDWINTKTAATHAAALSVSAVVAVVFVIYHAIKSKGSMARIGAAVIAAALFLFGVHHVTEVSDKVGSEVNSMTVSTPTPPPIGRA